MHANRCLIPLYAALVSARWQWNCPVSRNKLRVIAQPAVETRDIVDPMPVVAERWRTSVDSIMRAAKRGELKIAKLINALIKLRRCRAGSG